jgi:hypothetical protein
VWRRLRRRSGCRYLPAQGLDDAPGRNVPGAPEHDMECLAPLVVTGLILGVAIDDLHLPLSVLECHFFISLLQGPSFVCPPVGRKVRLLATVAIVSHRTVM